MLYYSAYDQLIANLLRFGKATVGLDHGHAGQSTVEEIAAGSRYGATTIPGREGSRKSTRNELEGARFQGRRIAEITKKVHR